MRREIVIRQRCEMCAGIGKVRVRNPPEEGAPEGTPPTVGEPQECPSCGGSGRGMIAGFHEETFVDDGGLIESIQVIADSLLRLERNHRPDPQTVPIATPVAAPDWVEFGWAVMRPDGAFLTTWVEKLPEWGPLTTATIWSEQEDAIAALETERPRCTGDLCVVAIPTPKLPRQTLWRV